MRKMISLSLLIIVVVFTACTSNSDNSKKTGISYIETGIDLNSWAFVPAGEFFKGQHNHEAIIDYDYEIMQTDVTNAQYANYLNEALSNSKIKIDDKKVFGYYPGDEFHGYKHEFEIKAGDKLHFPLDEPGIHIQFNDETFSAENGYENHPVVMVTWFGAKAYADYYGWRLPTEVEWEKAARGTDGRVYPWGDEITRNHANFISSYNVLQKIFGRHILTTPVGFYNGKDYGGYQTTEAKSPFGLYDMAGNVWQWTGDIYKNTHLRYMRGGSYENYEYNLRVWARNSAGPDYYGINVGFRCVRDVQLQEFEK